MKYLIALLIATLSGGSPALSGPLPVGTDTMPVQGGRGRPTPSWDKAHPELTSAQTQKLVHSSNQDVHSATLKRYVIKATEQPPSDLQPIWHVRGGTAFPVRDKQAEQNMLDQLSAPKQMHQRQVQATVVRTPKDF